jgi:hypothetical protein
MKSLLMALVLFGLSSLSSAETYYGEAVLVGDGTANVFVTTSLNGTPTEIGITFHGDSLKNLPMHDHLYLLPLPKEIDVPPYKHVSLDWNAHGHEPTGVYGVPHFDYHFYFTSFDDREKITCTGEDEARCMKRPPAEEIPQYYIAGPSGVPQMGLHWVDVRSPELNGHPFTVTFIYGSYDGKMTFVEPMIALSFLQLHGEADFVISTPQKYPQPGYYPQRYNLHYVSPDDQFFLTLKDLAAH